MRRTGRAGGLAGLAFALFFCLLLAAAGEVEGGVTWKYCKGDWEASISNVTVLPDPVRAGQEINVLIDGEIGRVVEGGELDLKVIFHKIPVYKETDDLCDRLETCPANGAFTVDAKQKLPPFTLPGKYQLQITAKDTEKKSLVCMMIDLDIKGPASFF
uniref:MD-2-related lipid-recognition domain-containing protein n=1 Tax=Chloropicon laureae TaxID=464258 RepID=A0A7S2Z3Q3_9CHLO|mmetsp:Transcript_4061/g.10274  ORF Transcript_4061/g.10274 Transcript_4061/m.10274 type:complete len:158 (+) Transcript_4061:117-590(+)